MPDEVPDEVPYETSHEAPESSIDVMEKSMEGPVMDPRDMAEELTEPIHKSPTYNESSNDRIVQLPHENNKEDEEKGIEEMEDTVEGISEKSFCLISKISLIYCKGKFSYGYLSKY